jgi:mannosylglycerate hydrolase
VALGARWRPGCPDRRGSEWYLPFERYRTKLVGAVDQVLDVLDADERFACYVLDGQTIILDDYLELRPHRREQLERAIGEGRLEIGPWYILPDEFLVSGESIIRNLLEGRRGAQRFGQPSPVGYLPDPFGHVAQLPLLLSGFGIPLVIFSRGMDDRIDEVGSQFEWVAADGESTVLAVVQMGHARENGYCNASPLSAVRGVDQDEALDWCDELADHLAPDSRLPVMLWAAGADHYSINPQLPDLIEQLDAGFANATVELGSLARYGERVLGAARQQEGGLATLRGELRGSRHAPILASIFSARIHLKQDNTRLQTVLERYAEPICALARLAGVHSTDVGTLHHAWRLALQNQPHDSIGGCSVDETHADMPNRTKRALEVADDLIREVTIALGCDDRTMVFNPHHETCGGIAEIDGDPTWIPDVPALRLLPLETIDHGAVATAGDGCIQNRRLRVGVSDGSVWLEDLDAGLRLEDVLSFFDEADAGDEYDFGRVDADRPIRASLTSWECAAGAAGVASLYLRYELALPDRLTAERDARSQTIVPHELEVELRLAGNLPWVECVVQWTNRAEDHRLRAQLSLGAVAQATMSNGHFHIVERPAEAPTARTAWKQDPSVVRHCESLAAIATTDHTRGLAVLTRGLHEFELGANGHGSTLDLTLLRAVGWLSRDDVKGRPGHAGPGLQTPGAQCLGPQRVEFAISPFDEYTDETELADRAARYSAPPLVLQPLDTVTATSDSWKHRVLDIQAAAWGGTSVSTTASPASASDPGPLRPHSREVRRRLDAFNTAAPVLQGRVLLSALKLADDSSGDVVMRVWNPSREPVAVSLVPPHDWMGNRVRLDETDDDPAAARPLPASGVASWRFRRRV